MRTITGPALRQAKIYMGEAQGAATQSSCSKAKCGAVIIKDGAIIGRGWNSAAGNERNRCNDTYEIPLGNKHNVTCCVHAEVRAIHDALVTNPGALQGSAIYFV